MSTHRPRQPRRRFLSPTGIRSTPMRDLTTPPLADNDEERRLEAERIGEALTLRDEPELIGDGWLSSNDLWIKQHLAEVQAAQKSRPLLAAEDRLKTIMSRAKQAHVNLSREVMIMQAEINRARGGGRQIPPRIMRRMENVEGLLDGVSLKDEEPGEKRAA